MKCFCKTKDTTNRTKQQPAEWEKIFANPTSERGLISKTHKELKRTCITTLEVGVEFLRKL